MDTRNRIQNYIATELIADKRYVGFSATDSLVDSGIIDSLGIIKLIGFLENDLAIRVSDQEMIPENFQTVEAIATFVNKKARPAAGIALLANVE